MKTDASPRATALLRLEAEPRNPLARPAPVSSSSLVTTGMSGEANLPRACVVNVSQLLAIDRRRLNERGGTLSGARVKSVLQGLALLLGTDRL